MKINANPQFEGRMANFFIKHNKSTNEFTLVFFANDVKEPIAKIQLTPFEFSFFLENCVATERVVTDF